MKHRYYTLFSLSLCSLWWVQIVGYVLACRSYSFVVQYIISLSSLCKLIWRHWTYKMPVRYILSSVWVRLSIFSQLSIIQYVGLCAFSLPISLVVIERIYMLCLIIIIKSEIWTITHCLGLGHEKMVCAVCLTVFLWNVFVSGCPEIMPLGFLFEILVKNIDYVCGIWQYKAKKVAWERNSCK